MNWVKGDTLTYHWIGVNLYGSTSGSVPITLATVGQPVRFRVDKQYVSANIGYYVTVIYTLLHAATGKYSYSAPLEVLVGIPLGRLLPPTVVQAPDGTLNPMHAINGVDIDCSYASMDTLLDKLQLKWRGTPGAGTSEDLEKPAETTGTVRFHLPPSFVGANIDREVAVNYDVQRYGLWTPSEILPLKVLNFQNPETELSRPEVPQAKAGELLVMELTGNANVLVKAWPFIALKQLVWLYIEGEASTGTYRIDLLIAHEVSSTQLTQGLNETLLKTELLKLLHGSNATVVCKVIFDNSTDEDAAIVFPKLPLVIRQHYEYVTPVITTVKTAQGTVIPEAGQTYDKRLTIEGTATRAEKVDIQINGISKDMRTVDANSKWTLTVDLIEGLQRVKAIAQYDADDKVSNPRTFTIAVATKPSITAVTDASGPVDDNDTTYFTEVTVSVHADSNQTVQLYDGITAIGSPIRLGANGAGSIKLSNLSLKTYTLKAKATYGDQLESAVRTFKVAAASAPTITSITDALGEVLHNDITFYNSVTITGTAVADQRVQIYDGATAITPDTPVDSNGNWSKTLTGLTATAHNIKVKALYGPQPESAVRAFTVAVASAPTITSITDALGEVPPNGITLYNSVTITGTAVAGQRVQIYDGATAITPDTPVDSNGNWSKTLTGLTATAHNIKVKALYGPQPESAVRAFTVAVASAPTIKSITDVLGEVLHNGITFYNSVTITGTAVADQRVQIYDGATAITPDTPVDSNGNWSKTLTGLTATAHNIKVKALYGPQPESAVRAFTVAVASAPTITSITDALGEVPPNGITLYNSVTITGTAVADQRVQIYDGATAITPDTPVDSNGNWSKTLTGLTATAHNIKVKALYGPQPESAVRAFTVAVASAPTITSITDALGEVLHNDITFYNSVTITGTAVADQRVQIYDGATAITPDTPVDSNGNWSKTLTGLTATAHNIKVKALYGLQPESAVRAFTVAVASTPLIVSVTDVKGSIGNNGITYENEVTVTVSADRNQRVQLYNRTVPIGSPITLDSNGSGSTRLSSLSQSTYDLKAKALYGNQLESPVHLFTVRAHLTTTLTSVRHSGGELGNGGKTTDTSVSVTGAATPLYNVQIFLNNVGGQTVPVNGSGVWTLTLGIHLGSNTVYARSVANNQQTVSRSFTRENPLAPLNFNTNPVTLGGKTYIIPGSPSVLPAFNSGNSVRHQASGGRPGYTYTSSNTGVAVVDSTGYVTVRGRGTATITARDTANQSKSYNVTVTNVIQCLGFGNATWTQANSSVASAGARIPSMAELYEIHAAYGNRWPMGNHHYWSTDTSNYWWPAPARKTLYISSGGEGSAKTPPFNDYSNVVGIK
ncbi:hypothetical protein [Pseudomonas sp. NMS19W]|uniref:hypothetical protein n=1 Tax=Pseudomonas sp. NMS19W TaxID=3079768 RepID=UPI003F65EE85